MATNPWEQWLNQEPSAAYFSYGNQWKTPNQNDYFKSQFSNIQNQYMGALGRQAQGGQAPTMEFTDFLNKFDWGQNFQQEGPRQDTSRFNPFTRWMT